MMSRPSTSFSGVGEVLWKKLVLAYKASEHKEARFD